MIHVQAAEKDQKKKQKAEEQQRLRAEEKKSADKEAKKKGAKGNADVGESSSSVQATQTSEKRASGRLTRSSATRPAASVVVNKTAEAKSKANTKHVTIEGGDRAASPPQGRESSFDAV